MSVEVLRGLAPFPWELNKWKVQNIDANLCLKRSSGLSRKGRVNAEISVEQTEVGAWGSGVRLGVSELGLSPRRFSLILHCNAVQTGPESRRDVSKATPQSSVHARTGTSP